MSKVVAENFTGTHTVILSYTCILHWTLQGYHVSEWAARELLYVDLWGYSHNMYDLTIFYYPRLYLLESSTA